MERASAPPPPREQAFSLSSMSIVLALVGAFGMAPGELYEDKAAIFLLQKSDPIG